MITRTLAWLAAVMTGLLLISGSKPCLAQFPPPTELKSARPPASGPYPPLAPLDCSQADTLILSATLVDTLSGDTTGAANLASGYSCVGWDESGGESVTRLEVPGDLEQIVCQVALQDLTSDLDVFILADCNSDACLAGANAELGVTLGPGVYYLVVDGYQGAAGPYTARVWCRLPGVPEQVCEPGFATQFICAEGTGVPVQGNIFAQDNLIEFYGCSSFLEQGGEVWYAVTLSATQQLNATLEARFMDGALWLFDGCGVAPTCLAFADQNVSGGTESLSYRNDTGSPQTVYLAVDAFRAAEDLLTGAFELNLACDPSVDSPSRSLGSFKTLYR